jgi:hypothetical protein
MDLKEIKIVLDWAREQVKNKEDSKITNPAEYDEAWKTVNKVKEVFDAKCKEWIKNMEKK